MTVAAMRSSPALRVSIVIMAVFAVLLCVREQSARAPGDHFLARFAKHWPKHATQLKRSIAFEAAVAARAGGRISSRAVADTAILHRKEPLATTPLMIAGAEAQIGGDELKAERLYAAARARNPRDPAARLLLANALLRRGAIEQGLEEMIALSQVMPNASAPVAPALAAFAKTPGAEKSLRPVLLSRPGLRDAVLSALAQDAENASLVLRLAPRASREPGFERPWEGLLLNSLVANGKIVEARSLWHDLTGLGKRDALIVNADFARWKAPPPFNWETQNATGGIAEFGDKPGLTVIYYGRDDVVLARQLLALPPGRYRLWTQTEGADPVDSIAWLLRCTGGTVVATLRLSKSGGGDEVFEIPRNCAAQWMELKGLVPEAQATVETRILGVKITRVAQ